MCLFTKFTDGEKKYWLDKKPEKIIMYKLVEKMMVNGRFFYYPRHKNSASPFFPERTNRISSGREPIKLYTERGEYKPFYHLFKYKKDAKAWKDIWYGRGVIVKCEVAKKDITDLGTQNERRFLVVIAKAFRIIKEVK